MDLEEWTGLDRTGERARNNTLLELYLLKTSPTAKRSTVEVIIHTN